ncbi:translocation/assembly module TamB domain-containing protein [uncultured Erythrobacter sp.]|uniref:translocation/assembly module TamB domain-containing protein n=1 Tax=uncultured Erythrobacter sp. TaxID=263913 RepID=UPI00260986A0|nr:translocation/assembly module TamB domain-containing protein [uncultured Erythrobacter sp.]
MAEENNIDLPEADTRPRKRVWAKRLGWAIAIIFAPLLLAAVLLSSPIGKRFVADQIASVAPASGLRFEVGRIEGDIYGQAVLHDVVLKDPNGVFLTIPEVELSWRPLAWLWSGLDIRELTARRGRLQRLPELLPGDPDAPILPDFDIRIDKLGVENFKLAEGLAGEMEQRVDFAAKVDIRKGRALIDASGAFGPEDRIDLLLDAEPDGDRFDLALEYRAAEDGPIAQLSGLDAAYEAQIVGEGTWSNWLGHALVLREITAPEDPQNPVQRARVAGFQLTNKSGRYGLLGMVTPDLAAPSILDRTFADGLALAVSGTLEASIFDGNITAVSDTLDLRGRGAIDLARNRADAFAVSLDLRDPTWLAPATELEGAQLSAMLDGPFRDLEIEHRLRVDALIVGRAVTATSVVQTGRASFDGETFRVPLNAQTSKVETGNPQIDAILTSGELGGVVTLTGSDLAIDNSRITFPGLVGELTLRGDLSTGAFALAGPVRSRSLALDNVGTLTADAKILAKFGSGVPWSVRANFTGAASQFSNATLANLAGETIRFEGSLGLGAGSPVVLRNVVLDSERLNARLDSRIVEARTALSGEGSHVQYGAFNFDASLGDDGLRADLLLADPYPAAGLKDVRIGIAPRTDGIGLDIEGGSTLGQFEGALALQLPEDGPGRIGIDSLRIFRTNVTGAVTLGDQALSGDLALSGGGLDGTIVLSPAANGAQGFDLDLASRGARFGGDVNAGLEFADVDASGYFDGNTSQIEGEISGRGLEYGALRLHAFNAKAQIVDGSGDLQASIAGRRADRFQLKLDGDFTPRRIALIAQGEYGGRAITMPRRAVLTALDDGGYSLARTQIGFASGFTQLEGQIGGDTTRIEASFAQMPLRLADLAGADLGLGGLLSGVATYNQGASSPATGDARFEIKGFTRSGLILSSRPIDVFAVANLSPRELAIGARLIEESERVGRLDARVSGLGDGSIAGQSLADRIMRGRLSAQLGYDGAAEALWRLLAIEVFDLTGPINVQARATGSLDSPRINGDLASDNLRLQSAISGTDIREVSARGRFEGSRLELTRIAGVTNGGGTVSGSGSVDLADISASRGPKIDIRAAVKDAQILNANGLDATITGPLRIVSDGVGGAIAGRVEVDKASWALGVAAEDMRLPNIPTRETGRAGLTDVGTPKQNSGWRYLIDAKSRSRVAVDGLGLDSEWGIDIALRGTVSDPRIGGEARLVRGDYRFAGTRFELDQGRIEFDPSGPIDPRLDIEARASANGTNVTIDITGNAQSPQIAFSSVPALPEEEILARLLFGGSVTSLSATDAIQLGAALASLQGGGSGLDPIGTLRRSIGLDQLRIVSADPALGRGTGVALGKNLGRRVYVELLTDGQGYSATQVEYRITSWLALLGSVTTIGRDSVLAEISRDY